MRPTENQQLQSITAFCFALNAKLRQLHKKHYVEFLELLRTAPQTLPGSTMGIQQLPLPHNVWLQVVPPGSQGVASGQPGVATTVRVVDDLREHVIGSEAQCHQEAKAHIDKWWYRTNKLVLFNPGYCKSVSPSRDQSDCFRFGCGTCLCTGATNINVNTVRKRLTRFIANSCPRKKGGKLVASPMHKWCSEGVLLVRFSVSPVQTAGRPGRVPPCCVDHSWQQICFTSFLLAQFAFMALRVSDFDATLNSQGSVPATTDGAMQADVELVRTWNLENQVVSMRLYKLCEIPLPVSILSPGLHLRIEDMPMDLPCPMNCCLWYGAAEERRIEEAKQKRKADEYCILILIYVRP